MKKDSPGSLRGKKHQRVTGPGQADVQRKRGEKKEGSKNPKAEAKSYPTAMKKKLLPKRME